MKVVVVMKALATKCLVKAFAMKALMKAFGAAKAAAMKSFAAVETTTAVKGASTAAVKATTTAAEAATAVPVGNGR